MYINILTITLHDYFRKSVMKTEIKKKKTKIRRNKQLWHYDPRKQLKSHKYKLNIRNLWTQKRSYCTNYLMIDVFVTAFSDVLKIYFWILNFYVFDCWRMNGREESCKEGNITANYVERKLKIILISHLISPRLEAKIKEVVPFFTVS